MLTKDFFLISMQKEKRQGCPLFFSNGNDSKKVWQTFGV
jgi:hypothetical protein